MDIAAKIGRTKLDSKRVAKKIDETVQRVFAGLLALFDQR